MCRFCCEHVGPGGMLCNDRPGHDGLHTCVIGQPTVEFPRAVVMEWDDRWRERQVARWN